jgi:hypothetical protein
MTIAGNGSTGTWFTHICRRSVEKPRAATVATEKHHSPSKHRREEAMAARSLAEAEAEEEARLAELLAESLLLEELGEEKMSLLTASDPGASGAGAGSGLYRRGGRRVDRERGGGG